MFFKNIILFMIVITFVIAACVGDGVGLDNFGEPIEPIDSLDFPIDSLDTPLDDSSFENIQINIFNAVCAVKCHKSPRPKKGLNLEPGEAYDNLVNIPSQEIPSMMRVNPGDSENSYIIWKLEERDGISGKRMPLNLPPLEETEIQAIKAWIDSGAQL
jgi:hypothetical protein